MVEWKKLGEVCEYFRGRSLSKTDIGLGEAKVILYGELYTIYGDYITSVKSKTSTEKAKAATSIQTNDLLLPVSSTTKEAQIGKASVYLGNDNVSLGSDAIILRNAANSAYLMYYLNSLLFEKEKMSCVHGTTIMHLSPKELVDKKIPIPSLEEQTRIVGILDTFTSAIDNLKEQIAQRRKQYEYYRDQLIDFGSKDKNETYKLGTICAIGDGIHGTPTYNDNGEYYFVNGNNLSNGQIFLKPGTKKVDDTMYYKYGIEFDSRTILMSINGTIGNIALYNNEKIILGKSAAYFKIKRNDIMYFRYLYYMLQTSFSKNYYNESLTGSTIKNLGLKALRCFDVFVPSLSEQQRIVSILDTFEASIQNLEAQLKQREKQYEYYRNKLLTFE